MSDGVRIVTQGVRLEWASTVETAVKTVNALVWGGRLKDHVDTIFILADSDGMPGDIPLLKGIADVYDPRDRSCVLHSMGLIPNGDSETMLAWAICHDLAHAFDVAHGNLKLDRAAGGLIYMGREYRLRQVATTSLPREYISVLHDSKYYEAHNHYEPWEVRPLMAADFCMAEIRRHQQPICPNLAA